MKPNKLVCSPVIALLLSIALLSGCSFEGFRAKLFGSSSVLASRIPPTDKIDENCATSPAYSMCIFMKDPVSQAQEPFADPNSPLVNERRIFGVKLTGVDGSGRLQNSSIEVHSLDGTNVNIHELESYKTKAIDDGSNFAEQQMAYYWANRTIEYLGARTGKFYARNQQIKIFVDDRTYGWRPATKSIHLKRTQLSKSMALNGGFIVHLLGQANLSIATNGEINNLTGSNKHKACGTSKYGCCLEWVGCSQAIAAGAADYLVAIMFPDDPGLGEFWNNSLDGAKACTQSRNLKFMSSITAQVANQVCASSGQTGEVHALGSVYASIWWEVRNKAEEERPGSSREVDTLYMEHLARLSGSDDFLTALSKIEELDAEMFGSRYSSKFRDEYQRRELF